MEYVTEDYLNLYLRTVQPSYDGTLGEVQKEAWGKTSTNSTIRNG